MLKLQLITVILIGFVYIHQEKIGVYRTSAVRSFVCPSGRPTFSSLLIWFRFVFVSFRFYFVSHFIGALLSVGSF
jgi:hypothetical protein